MLLATALLVSGVPACASVARTLGFQSSERVPFTVRNGADIGINVYMVPRTTYGDVFLGQVGPGRAQTFQLRRVARGDTVAFRATATDGRPRDRRDVFVLGVDSVWVVR